jgi:hypothetical protein
MFNGPVSGVARLVCIVVVAMLASVVLAGTASGQTSEITVPGSAYTHDGPLLPGVFEKGKTYTLEVSGTIDVAPPDGGQLWDAVYCYKIPFGTPCEPPRAVCGLQLTWFRGTTYSHFSVFGCPGAGQLPIPYQGSHVYTETIVPPFDAMIRVGVGDTVPDDNTGAFTVRVTGPPAGPARASATPALGETTSYAAPKPLVPLALRMPSQCVRPAAGTRSHQAAPTACRVDVSLARGSGLKIDDPGFIAAAQPSDENLAKAGKVCLLLLLDSPSFFSSSPSFGRCVEVVSRILQRDEELRQRRRPPTELVAHARGCRSVAVRPRRARGPLPLRVTCARTTKGLRITMRSAVAGTSLGSVLGRSPRLIVGRSRRAAARPGDRVNVRWTTPA